MIPVLGIDDRARPTYCPFTMLEITRRFNIIYGPAKKYIEQLQARGEERRAFKLRGFLFLDEQHAYDCTQERCSRYMKCYRGLMQFCLKKGTR